MFYGSSPNTNQLSFLVRNFQLDSESQNVAAKKATSKNSSTAKRTQVPDDELRWKCNEGCLKFETTDEIPLTNQIFGQTTAYEALTFGIECFARKQNVYVRGPRGTGRTTMVCHLLDELAPTCDTKRDYCYVHNFERPDHPRLLTLPAGTGHDFRREMNDVAAFFEDGLAKALEAEPHQSNRKALQDKLQQSIEKIAEPLDKELEANGMRLVSVQQGPASQAMILPVVNGEPVAVEQLAQLVSKEEAPAKQLEDYQAALPKYQKQMQETGQKINEIVRAGREKLREFDQQIARDLAQEVLEPVTKEFDGDDVKAFFEDVVNDLVENRLGPSEEPENFKVLYGVNVILSQEDDGRRPVVIESTPTLLNLLGMVESKPGPGGMAISDYRGIRAGALLRAANGYLVLDTNDLIAEPGAWRALMRTLRNQKLEIVPPEMSLMRQTVVTLPQSIDLNVRVILIGDAQTYYQLDHADPDFRELFKVLADFDSQLERNEQTLQQYAAVVSTLVHRESLPTFHRSAVGALAEHGARIVARRDRLTARFGRIADIAREAAYVSKGEMVTDSHVYEAVRRTKARASLPSRKFFEMVESRSIMVETDGDVVGQINGLAVMRAGALTYGFPARITASIGPGSAGLINIEGRAQMSGSIHTKGFQILGGLLRFLLRTDHPMAFTASIAFEQSYGGIDGDSASGAEIICLLSALTGVPVKQSMAITGAIDQHGHLEAIGGVNEKIEGFFDACNYFGLTGDQGVVVPKSNAGDLMLRNDIVEAAKDGKFRVHAVDNIYDAIELMTGVPAGQLDKEGAYPEGSLLAQAQEKVGEYWRKSLASPHAQAAPAEEN